MSSAHLDTQAHIQLSDAWGAHNYHPLPIVVERAEGVWLHAVDGKRYLDMLAAYSAINFGHVAPRFIEAAKRQLDRVTLTSRAFHNDQLGPFCKELAQLCQLDRVLPMNTGAEAVESAIKVARKWGYQVKGVPHDQAEILVCAGNFHGRTTTIISFSDDDDARADFGPYTPGFRAIPYGDADALEQAIGPNTVAFLVEPIQGEAGVNIPPDGYLTQVRELCSQHNVLMIADEIQAGLGRTGRLFACDYDGVRPDVLVLGKALGAGVVPISAIVARAEVMDTLQPGQHGSTFGGNPLACAVAREVIDELVNGDVLRNAARQGERLAEFFRTKAFPAVATVRVRGLWAGVDLKPEYGTARAACEALMQRGVLCKDTHGQTIRIAPPLVISDDELTFALEQFDAVLGGLTPA